MELNVAAALSVALGIGLAAATGFRVFIPLLIAAVAARAGWVPLNETFGWLDSNTALLVLGSAALAETLAYYIPGVDHVLDVLAAPVALLAGMAVSAAVMVDIPPEWMWPLAIVAGGSAAALTKGGSALVRAKTGVATAGFGNPIVSTAETFGAAGIAVLAIAVPLLCLAIVAFVLIWATRRIVRFFVSRRSAAAK
jgi:hypothetical protein